MTPAGHRGKASARWRLSLSIALFSATFFSVASAQGQPRACDGEQVAVSGLRDTPAALATLEKAKVAIDADLLVIGDSIANRWPPDDLRRALNNKSLAKFAIGGGRIEDLSTVLLQAGPIAAKTTILLVLGTNNINHDSTCAFGVRFEAFFTELRRRAPSAAIYVMNILPKGRFVKAFDAQIDRGNLELSRLADRFRLTLVNGHDPVKEKCTGEESCALFEPDRLHPSSAGYELLTDILSKSVSSQKAGISHAN